MLGEICCWFPTHAVMCDVCRFSDVACGTGVLWNFSLEAAQLEQCALNLPGAIDEKMIDSEIDWKV
jgi:hypothetical protein